MKIRYSKNDKRYWIKKVGFHTSNCRTYSVTIQHARERRRIGLRTADKEHAGDLALKFYQKLRVDGWDETLRWWRGDLHDSKKSDVTVGEYIEAVTERSIFRPRTLQSYVSAFRQLVGEIADACNRGERDRIKLRRITPAAVEAWRVEFIRKRSTNPLKEKSARVSMSSLMLRARQLFSAEMVARVKDIVELPTVLPFAGIKIESAPMPRYRSTFEIVELLDAAQRELADDHPEQFKILLLAALAGLRRNEIDSLPWNAFRFDENVIRIEATEHYRPKSHTSEGDVLVDPELMELFRGYFARRKSDFVIESEFEPPTQDERYGTYRCRTHMCALLDWLRRRGVVSKSPLHSLRKEFGSQVHEQHGLLAASEQLRHANIQTSARHYVENRRRATPGLGHLLKSERTVVPMREATSA
jgi:integrase